MKNSFLVVLLSGLVLGACTKSADELTAHDEATVYAVKYPCGPSCTAQGWIITTTAGTTYEPTNLPDNYEMNALPVKVTYRKTGQRSAPNAGTGEELITIEDISRR